MMLTMNPRKFVSSVAIFTAFITACSAKWYPSVYYLEDYCQKSLTVRNDIIIKISRKVYLPSNWLCSVTLRPYSGYEVVASFHSYYMSSAYTYSSTCIYEAMQLGSSQYPNILGPYGYCKSYTPSSQYHLTNMGTVSFATGPYSYLTPPSIQLLITEVYARNSTGYCTGGRFDCNGNNQCIDQQLTCNGYDDCANDNDEFEGCGITLSTGVIGGIVAGVFIFIVLVVVLSLLVRRQRMRVTYIQYQ